MNSFTEFCKSYVDPAINCATQAIGQGALGAIAAPLITAAAAAVGSVAFAVTPLQGFIFCGSLGAAQEVTNSMTDKAFQLLRGKKTTNTTFDCCIENGIYAAIYLAKVAAVFFGITAMAPSLSIPFTSFYILMSAPTILLGVAAFAGQKAQAYTSKSKSAGLYE